MQLVSPIHRVMCRMSRRAHCRNGQQAELAKKEEVHQRSEKSASLPGCIHEGLQRNDAAIRSVAHNGLESQVLKLPWSHTACDCTEESRTPIVIRNTYHFNDVPHDDHVSI